jgi:hypothetical protein
MPIAVPKIENPAANSINKSAITQTSSAEMVNTAAAQAEGSGLAAQANGVAEQVRGAGGKPLPQLYKYVLAVPLARRQLYEHAHV